MGGTPLDELPTYPLCRSCHDSLHRSEWMLSTGDGMAFGFAGEVQLFERAISLDDKSADPRAWTDQRLAAEWDMAEERTRQNMGVMALVAWTFHERYGWADNRRDGFSWYERAADMITQHTGRQVHWRDVYRLVDIYRAFREKAGERIDTLGLRLALACAKAETDPEYAATWAQAARDNGHTVVEVEAGLKHEKFGTVQSSEPCIVHCNNCDTEVKHRRRL